MKKVSFLLSLVCMPLLLLAIDTTALEEKARYGDAEAAYTLALYYEEEDDKERAFLWYKQAAMLSLEKKIRTNKST